ncbi:MAG: hypothetical protein WAW13_04945 [Minisyncoccia bacterium]
MIQTAKSVRTLQAVAMTVGIALFLWSTGLPTLFRFAEASSITFASDTLSTSAPSASADHTFAFTTPNGMAAGQTITLTFAAQFTLPPLGTEDFDLTASGTEQTIASSNGVNIWGVSTSSQTITFTSPSNVGQASATPFVIQIGTNATAGGAGDTQIVNPAATTSYAIDLGGTMPDSGQVRVAIVDQVVVSASVDTSLTFSVTGVNTGATVNGSPTTTVATSTATTLPFGTLPIGTSRTLAHDLAVTTNAAVGYTVTVEQTGALQSTTGATIDGFIDGANTVTPTAWVGPSAAIANPNTYGHWGITSTDGTTTRSAPDEFSSNTWASGSTTPIVIMGHTGPADGTTEGVGAARVGYQVQISALQEAGDDYTTTLRYIVTPTF